MQSRNINDYNEQYTSSISSNPQYKSQNLELEQAITSILNEVNKKDQRIRELEDQVKSLTILIKNQETLIAKFNKNNNYAPTSVDDLVTIGTTTNNNINVNKNTRVETHENYQQNKISDSLGMNFNGEMGKSVKMSQSVKRLQNQWSGNNIVLNISRGSKETSQSRNEVKKYLNEVKAAVDPQIFKEFVKYIKLLTEKERIVNRKEIFEKVRILFGEEYKELYNKLEKILRTKNN